MWYLPVILAICGGSFQFFQDCFVPTFAVGAATLWVVCKPLLEGRQVCEFETVLGYDERAVFVLIGDDVDFCTSLSFSGAFRNQSFSSEDLVDLLIGFIQAFGCCSHRVGFIPRSDDVTGDLSSRTGVR